MAIRSALCLSKRHLKEILTFHIVSSRAVKMNFLFKMHEYSQLEDVEKVVWLLLQICNFILLTFTTCPLTCSGQWQANQPLKKFRRLRICPEILHLQVATLPRDAVMLPRLHCKLCIPSLCFYIEIVKMRLCILYNDLDYILQRILNYIIIKLAD